MSKRQKKDDAILGGLKRREATNDTVSLSEESLSPVRKMNPALLRPHPDNARYFTNDPKKRNEVFASIKSSGILQPIVFLPDDAGSPKQGGVIYAGHVRHSIAIELGLNEIPVRWVEDEKSQDLLALLTGDNLSAKKNDIPGKILILADLYPDYFTKKRADGSELHAVVEASGVNQRTVQRYKDVFDRAFELSKRKRVERSHINEALKEVRAGRSQKNQAGQQYESQLLEIISKATNGTVKEQRDAREFLSKEKARLRRLLGSIARLID